MKLKRVPPKREGDQQGDNADFGFPKPQPPIPPKRGEKKKPKQNRGGEDIGEEINAKGSELISKADASEKDSIWEIFKARSSNFIREYLT